MDLKKQTQFSEKAKVIRQKELGILCSCALFAKQSQFIGAHIGVNSFMVGVYEEYFTMRQ